MDMRRKKTFKETPNHVLQKFKTQKYKTLPNFKMDKETKKYKNTHHVKKEKGKETLNISGYILSNIFQKLFNTSMSFSVCCCNNIIKYAIALIS